MNVLIACEESQAVCKAFRELGHRAYSADIQECSGGHPEWHIKGDVLKVLNGYTEFTTQDGTGCDIGKWDLIIAHPPCTYLTNAGNRYFNVERYGDKARQRILDREEAVEFFNAMVEANCDHIAIENPRGVMSTRWRKPDQYIHPYYFTDSVEDKDNYACKLTGLWLKGLPTLKYEITLPSPLASAERWSNGKAKSWTETRHGSVTRSKTFEGIARAMASQWSEALKEE